MPQNDDSPEKLARRIGVLEQDNASLRSKIAQVEKDRVEYLQNVSHQLVAPLNAIKWHIENLTECGLALIGPRRC